MEIFKSKPIHRLVAIDDHFIYGSIVVAACDLLDFFSIFNLLLHNLLEINCRFEHRKFDCTESFLDLLE